MIKKKNIGLLIVYIGMAFLIIFFLSQYTDLFSAGTITTTPTWYYKSGCIDDGDKGICYDTNYNIGELSLSSNAPSYHKEKTECQFSGLRTYPQMENCWYEEFSFEGNKFSLKPYETVKLNKYLEVTWEPSGVIYNGPVCHNICTGSGETKTCNQICKTLNYEYDWNIPIWTSKFTFNIYDNSFFITTIKDKHLSDTITEKSFVIYQIFNDLTKIDGGAVVRETYKLWSPSNSQKSELFKIFKGTNLYKTETSSETLGDKNILINPFMIVNNVDMGVSSQVYIYSNSDEKELRILPNIEKIPTQDEDFFNRNKPIVSTNFSGYELVTPQYLFGIEPSKIILALIISLIIVGGILYVKK